MVFKTKLGKEYHYCKNCENKDFECNLFCPLCGQRQRYVPKQKHNRKEYNRI